MQQAKSTNTLKKKSLKKFAYFSIAVAISTIGLKTAAYLVTGSMGLLSDALESVINLLAAIVALIMIHIAEKPADKGHDFGHSKAEYFSSAIEGILIIFAALGIMWTSIPRLFHPVAIENLDVGIYISLVASLLNFVMAQVLLFNGKKYKSILLEADGKHLMTDVWTSIGVILGIILVGITNFLIIDPIIAILVAINIIWIGYKLIVKSANGLMDGAITSDELEKICNYLDDLKTQQIDYHSLMTRQAGRRKFISFHILVPGNWSIKEGHDLADKIEKEIEDLFFEPVHVTTHIEPIEDPISMLDIGIERKPDTTQTEIDF